MKTDNAYQMAVEKILPTFSMTDEDGGKYIPVDLLRAWFRLVFPKGKIDTTEPIPMPAEGAGFYSCTARVYESNTDMMDNFLAKRAALRGPSVIDGKTVSGYTLCQTAAISLALRDAGFTMRLEDVLDAYQKEAKGNNAEPQGKQSEQSEESEEQSEESTDVADVAPTPEPAKKRGRPKKQQEETEQEETVNGEGDVTTETTEKTVDESAKEINPLLIAKDGFMPGVEMDTILFDGRPASYKPSAEEYDEAEKYLDVTIQYMNVCVTIRDILSAEEPSKRSVAVLNHIAISKMAEQAEETKEFVPACRAVLVCRRDLTWKKT